MEIAADTHIHIYPVHDAAALIRGAARRLLRAAPSPAAVPVLFLAEGRGIHFFDRLLSGTHGLPGSFKVEGAAEPGSVRVTWDEGESAWILAGRQLVTAERVEILALALTGEIEDGLEASAAVQAVLDRGGVPVLAWAPGKWMFKRAGVVGRLLEDFGPGLLLLGDTSLRPLGWPRPAPMRDPDRVILAGSDPLPLAGEESEAGRYGVRIEGDFDRRRPLSSLRRLLVDPAASRRPIGRRNPPWRAGGRLFRHNRRSPAPR
ncbi:MAG: hypothetical protein P9M08_12210 [Candidatus Erginobacter occultus]|nr:hypothetical protein [Candidatus Erginobacter occultus]